ncbi:aldehyde dehydrogenase family protein [Nocardioides convexus]|uniref:aldehyde dehydrogenase family protein n=1 Tax=Nocardioides convexus TaxID=2712224 RepID=UPI00241850DF|nr:aldehyde dehydrogenase family protein [Nocardioides convexus]
MTSTEAPAATTFDSLNPATGEVVGTHPIHDAAQVRAAVDTARKEAERWRALGFDGRKKALVKWRKVIARRMDETRRADGARDGQADR